MHRRAATCATALWLIASTAWAHGGGLNAEGCHNNRKTGDYHCHRAPSVGPATTTRGAAPTAPPGTTAQPLTAQPRPVTPTCYTGPRGGTYTITASGRKNYGGC